MKTPRCVNQALQRLSACQALHQELVAPEVLNVLLDLLRKGDECCRTHAAGVVANLATDEVGLDALGAGGRWVPALMELVRLVNIVAVSVVSSCTRC